MSITNDIKISIIITVSILITLHISSSSHNNQIKKTPTYKKMSTETLTTLIEQL